MSVKGQTFTDYEHLVVDGASTDRTLKVVDECDNPRIRVDSRRDSGIYDGMNRGRDLAKGDYLIYLNAGDRFHSVDTLAKIAEAAQGVDKPGIIYGQTDIVDLDGRRLGARHLRAPEVLTLESFSVGMVVCHQAFVALKKITSRFDERYKLSADYDWCIRCLQRSRRNVYVDEVLVDYLYEGASTRHRRRSLWERYRIMSYYYGTMSTLWRHLKFIPRRIKRRREEKNF